MSASPASYAREINANTIMLYTSAPSYPHGVVDPIPEIAGLAKTAGIGCVDCKQPLIDSINSEQEIIRQRAVQFEDDPDLVHAVIAEGSEKARAVARETMEEVKAAVGIGGR